MKTKTNIKAGTTASTTPVETIHFVYRPVIYSYQQQ